MYNETIIGIELTQKYDPISVMYFLKVYHFKIFNKHMFVHHRITLSHTIYKVPINYCIHERRVINM